MNSGMSRAGIPSWPTVSAEALISVHGVSKRYPGSSQMLFAPKQWVRAVDDVSFAVERNEILAIIGESGSGKSTLTRMLVGLERPTSGHVEVAGHRMDGDLKYVRRQVQIVFQDPYTSLDPRLPVGESIREPLQALGYEGDLARRVQAELDAVALPAGAEQVRHDRLLCQRGCEQRGQGEINFVILQAGQFVDEKVPEVLAPGFIGFGEMLRHLFGDRPGTFQFPDEAFKQQRHVITIAKVSRPAKCNPHGT